MATSIRLARAVGRAALAVLLTLQVSTAAAGQQASTGQAAPEQLLTRPEISDYTETSRYDEVVAYMKAMAAADPRIHLTTCGYTSEGRPLPLAVFGAAGPSPAEVRREAGKTRIYIQGSIHAGEVEGKEAALWLLRSIARGEHDAWFDSVVLLINPIYNADGNERVNLRNRGSQNGPLGGMGTRHNAQDLDLNRDNTKLETPEARSLARLMTDYDPHIAIDLHTTNGSNHGFYITYETSLNPNTSPGITSLTRGELLPAVTKAVKAKHGWSFFYYGGVSRQGERAWRGDAELYKPRYTQTYFGLRNRIGILSETYSYASFEDRIKSNYWFLEEIVNFAAQNGERIRQVTAAADAESIVGKPQAVRGQLVKLPDPVEVILADVVEERNPYVPDRPFRRRVDGSERPETMPHYGIVEATETSIAPRAYIVPALAATPPAVREEAAARPGIAGSARAPQSGRGAPPPGQAPPAGQGRAGGPGGFAMRPALDPTARMIASVVDRLEGHGIRYFKTSASRQASGERFKIESSTVEAREYQGTHKLRTLTGAWEAAALPVPAGSLVIPMDQPLARLAFILMDPRSDDGFMAWNILDPVLTQTPPPEFYPVWRTMEDIQK